MSSIDRFLLTFCLTGGWLHGYGHWAVRTEEISAVKSPSTSPRTQKGADTGTFIEEALRDGSTGCITASVSSR